MFRISSPITYSDYNNKFLIDVGITTVYGNFFVCKMLDYSKTEASYFYMLVFYTVIYQKICNTLSVMLSVIIGSKNEKKNYVGHKNFNAKA